MKKEGKRQYSSGRYQWLWQCYTSVGCDGYCQTQCYQAHNYCFYYLDGSSCVYNTNSVCVTNYLDCAQGSWSQFRDSYDDE